MKGNCGCGHHVVDKILVILAWVAAVVFWWTEWKGGMFWDAETLFRNVVVFSLLAFGTKFCRCCYGSHGGSKDMMKEGMKCEACEGRGEVHNH